MYTPRTVITDALHCPSDLAGRKLYMILLLVARERFTLVVVLAVSLPQIIENGFINLLARLFRGTMEFYLNGIQQIQ